MTRALITQMLEALRNAVPLDSKQAKEQLDAITAAREYLAIEQSGERADLANKPTLRSLTPQEASLMAEALRSAGVTGEVVRVLAFNDQPKAEPSGDHSVEATTMVGERAELIAAHQELNTNNYTRDDVEALNHWANRAYDMLEADERSLSLLSSLCDKIRVNTRTEIHNYIEEIAQLTEQQAKQVPMTDGEIYTAYVTAANQTLRPQDERIALAFARAIEVHHGIGGEA